MPAIRRQGRRLCPASARHRLSPVALRAAAEDFADKVRSYVVSSLR